MQIINVHQFLERHGHTLSHEQLETFRHLSNRTALRHSQAGYVIGNLWRGPLLYALMHICQPRCVLEIGTGRGYGALSMAWGAADACLDCEIYTIDMLSPDQKRTWLWDTGDGPRVDQMSLHEVWSHLLTPEIRHHIRCLVGPSYAVLGNWRRANRPRPDFVFIDGSHDYWTVKHDWFAALSLASDSVAFLLDDYSARFGVKRIVDEEIVPRYAENACVGLDMGRDPAIQSTDNQHVMAWVQGIHGRRGPAALAYLRLAAWTVAQVYQPLRRLGSRVLDSIVVH